MKNWRQQSEFLCHTFTALALLVAASCTQSFDANASRSIGTISVDGPKNPDHYGLAIGNVGGAIALGAAVGPGAAAGDLAGSLSTSAKANNLTDVLASQHLLLGDEMNAAVRAALTEDGYNVATAGHADSEPPVDAILHITIEESTYERRVWGKIGPHLIVGARLTNPVSGRLLFSRTYSYDMYAHTVGYTLLRPADEFGFDEPDDVLAHANIAAAGFRAAIPMIAADIRAALKRQ